MRNPYVDYLRGASILLVLGCHFTILPPSFPGIAFILAITANGYYGVSIFFVISGYLITSRTLTRYGNLSAVSLREFYAMRLGRIGPCLVVSLAALVALNAANISGFTNDDIWTRLFYALTFRFNLYDVHHGGTILAWAVLWSLSVEELFYLTFPLACRLYQSTPYLCIVLIVVVLNGPWYRYKYYLIEGNAYGILMYLGCFDAIALGCLAAMLTARRPIRSRGAAACVAIGGLVVAFASIACLRIASHFVLGPTGVAIGAALYLTGVHGRGSPPALSWPLKAALAFLAVCGILSYEIYLYHGIFDPIVTGLFDRSVLKTRWPITAAIGYTALFVTISFCCSLAIHRYYAAPVGRKLRRSLAGRKRPNLADPDADIVV